MKLSDLKTGERGVIVKVTGHGGFRKRIVEMGFIKGKVVDVLLNAPLQDPVKYKIMGYEVSLRHSEADMIEVISEEEAKKLKDSEAAKAGATPDIEPTECEDNITDEQLHDAAMRKRRIINVALVGTRIAARPLSSISHQEPTNMSATIQALPLTPKKATPHLKVISLTSSTCPAPTRSQPIRQKNFMCASNS